MHVRRRPGSAFRSATTQPTERTVGTAEFTASESRWILCSRKRSLVAIATFGVAGTLLVAPCAEAQGGNYNLPRDVAATRQGARAVISNSADTDTLRLSLDSARMLALRANPNLRAARLTIDIARGESRQAGLLLRDNPEADILAGGLGAELAIAQQVEIAGQRGARRAAAAAGVDRASADVTDMARTILGEVDRSFYRLVAGDRRVALADEILALTERLADASHRQLEAGDISRLEFNLATVEFGRSRGRALAARRLREEIASELKYLLGLLPETPLMPVVDSLIATSVTGGALAAAEALDVDSLIRVALSRRPDLTATAAAVRQASADVSLARREAFPNLVLRATSERVEGIGTRELRPGLGFTIPAFNRNQGEIRARRAAALQADLTRESVAARVRIDVSRAVASYRSAATQAVLAETVLAPARENRSLLEIAYREGKVGLPVLLLIRNQVIDAELEYWDAWLAEREAFVDLLEATGETVRALGVGTTR